MAKKIQDMGTRRLKRKYIWAVRGVWYWEKASIDAPRLSADSRKTAVKTRNELAEELNRRGWSA